MATIRGRGGRGRGPSHLTTNQQPFVPTNSHYDGTDGYNTRSSSRARASGPGQRGSPRGRGSVRGGRDSGSNGGGGHYSNHNSHHGQARVASEDKDGDLQMGAAPAPPPSRFSPYGRPRVGQRLQQGADDDMKDDGSGGIQVTIEGYNGNVLTNFIGWLNRKTRLKWEPTNIRQENQTLYFQVSSQQVAQAVARLNGFTFAEQTLTITVANASGPLQPPQRNPPTAAPHLSTIDTLRIFLQSRWQPESKYLNLDNMDTDANLRQARIRGPGTVQGTGNVGAVIMKLSAEMFGEVHTISLAGNQLRDVRSISTIAQFQPKLLNLSLKDNEIMHITGLEAITGPGKLKDLRELVLIGNHIRDKEINRSGDDLAYRSEITRKFPSLKVLDGVAVAPTIQFDIPEAAILSGKDIQLPAQVKGNFFDSDSTKTAAIDFVTRFFSAFDNNRALLLDLYDPNATFSLAINTFVPQRARDMTPRFDHSKSDWGGWIGFSRNLSRIKDLGRRFQTIHRGNQAILSVLTQLPLTTHDLNKPERFCLDGWQMNGFEAAAVAGQAEGSGIVLFLTMHGEFLEGPNRVTRSFDRTFIVAPAAPGSRAQASGWPYVILSDQLGVRIYVGYDAWKPEPPAPAATIPSQVTSMIPAIGAPPQTIPQMTVPLQIVPEKMIGLSDVQHGQALELQRHTGLNYPFAVQCLTQNEWDMARGMEAFQLLKAEGRIPPQAYV